MAAPEDAVFVVSAIPIVAQVDHGDVVERRFINARVVVLRTNESERDLLKATRDTFWFELINDRQRAAAFRP
ncbi:hypothetical protein D3C80_2167180 [compost metagenome]